MTKEKYAIAYSEVLIIINNMNEINRNKIPSGFIKFLEENKDLNYNVEKLSLNNANELKRETRIIMALIYRDFFLSEEEREIKDKEKTENEIKKYSYENIFKNTNKNDDIEEMILEEVEIETSLIDVQKNNVVMKILNKIKKTIKSIFKV